MRRYKALIAIAMLAAGILAWVAIRRHDHARAAREKNAQATAMLRAHGLMPPPQPLRDVAIDCAELGCVRCEATAGFTDTRASIEAWLAGSRISERAKRSFKARLIRYQLPTTNDELALVVLNASHTQVDIQIVWQGCEYCGTDRSGTPGKQPCWGPHGIGAAGTSAGAAGAP